MLLSRSIPKVCNRTTARQLNLQYARVSRIGVAAPVAVDRAIIPQRSFSDVSSSFLSGSNSVYVDSMYDSWKSDPTSVHSSWNAYFASMAAGGDASSAFVPPPAISGKSVEFQAASGSVESSDTAKIMHLIAAFQRRGHEMANLDPLGITEVPQVKDLDPMTYGFTDSDWDRALSLGGSNVGAVQGLLGNADVNNDGKTTLRELVNHLNATYCGNFAVELEAIQDLHMLNWLRSRIEKVPEPYTKECKASILERLCFSESFEKILAKRFGAMKRFGLEGTESMIPGLKFLVDRVTELGVEEVVVGMPHRGRLNVLGNVIRKPIEIIFKEFKGVHMEDPEGEEGADDWSTSGDVKYHMGSSYHRNYPDGRQVNLELLPNPSHLEAVNPLVVGKARAKMDMMGDKTGHKVMPIIIHGDAAFAGQGIVYETMQMAQLDAYQTGGTVNVICNNQIGFTANPDQARSTRYASDLGKAFGCPIFHVNADDTEAVVRAFMLAADFRQEFHKDVVIDLIGYRKHGHNEVDEPMFTQPQMYKKIKSHPSPMTLYKEKLLAEGSFSAEEIAAVEALVENEYNKAWDLSETIEIPTDTWKGTQSSDSPWQKMKVPMEVAINERNSGVEIETLKKVGKALSTTPEGFNLHKNLKKASKAKEAMFASGKGVDWATAEALAIGSLLMDGVNARMTGQDVERGTFSHRHAKVVDQVTGEKHTWVNNIEPDQQHKFYISNSFLSEYGVLGFELGYSFEHPDNLIMWEAQFGDFVNGAQIIIDQFLSAGEAKWMRQSGLVMMLPHGYQGMGPEHSSCRIERFLQCSDEDPDEVPANLDTVQGRTRAMQRNNWIIVNPTTPANYFHVLRRQLYSEFRKPLIIPSTKALLRDKMAVSDLADFGPNTKTQRIYPEMFTDEDGLVPDEEMKRVVFCSGKIYYELLAKRRSSEVKDVALVRVEQLSPFPFDLVAEQVKKYDDAEVVWAQEEPKNMGAWSFVQERFLTATREINQNEKRATYIGRSTMASPADGYADVHADEQARIISEVIGNINQ